MIESERVAAADGNGLLGSHLMCGHSRWFCILTAPMYGGKNVAVIKCNVATVNGLSSTKGYGLESKKRGNTEREY